MKVLQQKRKRTVGLVMMMIAASLFSRLIQADTGTCGGQSMVLPFTDVPATNIFFCSIAQAYFTGLTNGTTPTTYSPSDPVPREQMAAFITRTQDSALKRGSRRAAAGQWATPQDAAVLNITYTFDGPMFNCSDGEDIWVANFVGDTVTRIHASDGRSLGNWTGANAAHNTIAAAGFIYVVGRENPGKLYRIDPSQAPGAVTLMGNSLGSLPVSITYDGLNLWTANVGTGPGLGSITRYNIATNIATTFGTGFNQPAGIVFDGRDLWVVDAGDDALYRLNAAHAMIVDTIDIGTISSSISIPCFDGSNIWVPVTDGLKVVSTSTPPRVLATLTGNGLAGDNLAVAFDGERMMVTNPGAESVSLWKATSLTPLGKLNLGSGKSPRGVCSDGLNFWIAVNIPGSDFVMRF
jgi:hypothetical protein